MSNEAITPLIFPDWVFTLALYGGFFLYVYFSLCLQIIAQKTKTQPSWWAWIPFLNVFLLCKIGKVPWWWGLVILFVPLIGFIFYVILHLKVAEARKKPSWIGLLILIPFGSFFVYGYLAFSE